LQQRPFDRRVLLRRIFASLWLAASLLVWGFAWDWFKAGPATGCSLCVGGFSAWGRRFLCGGHIGLEAYSAAKFVARETVFFKVFVSGELFCPDFYRGA
jgi:hypothetical protein